MGGSAPGYYRTHAYARTETYPRVYIIYILYYTRAKLKNRPFIQFRLFITTNLLYIIYITLLSFFLYKKKKLFSPLNPLYHKKKNLFFIFLFIYYYKFIYYN